MVVVMASPSTEPKSGDHLVHCVLTTHNLRVAAAVTTSLVGEAATRHELSPIATCAVGRALTSGLLLATLAKGKERVTVQLLGSGPLGSITVDATNEGAVRGYALHPQAGPPVGSGRVRVADALGRAGVLNVLRDLGLKELYQGQVALTTGEVDEDVETYLRHSEQVPSALGCDVILDATGRVRAAGGVLVQALPGVVGADGDFDSVREAQHAFRSGRLYELLVAGESSAETIARQLFGAESIQRIGDERSLRFACPCNQERIHEMLALLGVVDLDEMIAEGKPTEITCNYCNTHYQVAPPELETIRSRVRGPRQQN